LTAQWALHQDKHLKDRKIKTAKHNGTTWATNLASTMLNEWLALWKLRNEDMHGRDKTAQTRARAAQIRREVELLYEQADQAPPNYTDHIYRHDLDTQLEKATADLIGWLSNWAPVVHQHHQLLKQQQLQLQQRTQIQQQQHQQQELQQELQ
jgi:type IV secretory pathway VirJ component